MTQRTHALHFIDEPLISCENVGELHYAKFLWLDERVFASEVSFAGRPMIAIRALRGGDWLRAHKTSSIAPQQLLRWVREAATFLMVVAFVLHAALPVF